jgi:SnoaL-like domain
MSSIQLLEDRLAIYELQNAYSDAVTRHEGKAWISCWHSDGVWEKFDESFVGHDEILAEWQNVMINKSGGIVSGDVRLFTATPGVLEISGNKASGRAYINIISESEDGSVTRTAARYDDLYRNVDGHWLFLSRRFSLLHVNTIRE